MQNLGGRLLVDNALSNKPHGLRQRQGAQTEDTDGEIISDTYETL